MQHRERPTSLWHHYPLHAPTLPVAVKGPLRKADPTKISHGHYLTFAVSCVRCRTFNFGEIHVPCVEGILRAVFPAFVLASLCGTGAAVLHFISQRAKHGTAGWARLCTVVH